MKKHFPKAPKNENFSQILYLGIKKNKLGLSSAKLSRTKFGCREVIFEFVMKQFTVKKILCSKKFGQNFFESKKF